MNKYLDMLYIQHTRSWDEIIGVDAAGGNRVINYFPGDNNFFMIEDGVYRTFTIVDSRNDLRFGDMVSVSEITYIDGRIFIVLQSIEATICGECISVSSSQTPTHAAVVKSISAALSA